MDSESEWKGDLCSNKKLLSLPNHKVNKILEFFVCLNCSSMLLLWLKKIEFVCHKGKNNTITRGRSRPQQLEVGT